MSSSDPRCTVNLKLLLQVIEQEWIIDTLRATRGNITEAARFLQMNRTTLVEKMRRYKIRCSVNPEREETPCEKQQPSSL